VLPSRNFSQFRRNANESSLASHSGANSFRRAHSGCIDELLGATINQPHLMAGGAAAATSFFPGSPARGCAPLLYNQSESRYLSGPFSTGGPAL
jgi:hypothetical protein